MLYRDNEILIFDEPPAVLTPQGIKEFMAIMRSFTAEGKSILFITHKLAEAADRCTMLRKGQYVGTVDVKHRKEKLSRMMVGRISASGLKRLSQSRAGDRGRNLTV